jgi:Flp pilus assembly protein TadG
MSELSTRATARRTGARTLGAEDGGNAIVEFVYLAVLLMVPLVYVLLTVFTVQRAAYAASSAAREAGRVYVTSESLSEAGPRAFTAASIVMRDSNLALNASDLRIRCSSEPCLTPGSRVDVVVAYDVSLPLLPRILDGRAPATVRVTSRHLEVVDRFRDGAQ